MRKKLLFILFIMCILCNSSAQNTYFVTQSPVEQPLHEMRAVWLTTIGGIDWPHYYSQSQLSAEKQQKELCTILDQLVAAGYNTVLIQTRIRATTIFPSDLEPWDGCLSGFPGKSPGYDALEYAVKECHKRGMKLHAWVVTIPVGKWNKTGCASLRKTHPELLKKIGDEGFMNPEHSGTSTYLANFCRDIAERYDIDGIHLDYIRYPETWKAIGNRDKGRENITRIVRAVHDAVKAVKPWVMMSCSPVGKYADTKRKWSHGWNARDVVCQDAVRWLDEGLMDCLFPMMYFRGENFYPFAIDWQERSNGKIITPGLGIYFMHPREKNWPLSDITQELHVLRQYGMGNCLFRSKFFTDNTKGLYDYVKDTYSPLPSLQPAMKWYDVRKPDAVTSLATAYYTDGTMKLSWESEGADVRYNVYGSDVLPVDVTKAENLLAAELETPCVVMPQSASVRYFAVTATDRYGNESEPRQSVKSSSGSQQAEHHTPMAFLPVVKGRVVLDGKDVTDGQLLVVKSVEGVEMHSCFARYQDGHLSADIASLPQGYYSLYFINKKGHQHKIGNLSVFSF